MGSFPTCIGIALLASEILSMIPVSALTFKGIFLFTYFHAVIDPFLLGQVLDLLLDGRSVEGYDSFQNRPKHSVQSVVRSASQNSQDVGDVFLDILQLLVGPLVGCKSILNPPRLEDSECRHTFASQFAVADLAELVDEASE